MTLALPSSAVAGSVYLGLAALAVLGWVVFELRRWPWRRCRSCHGNGRLPSPTSDGWRDCPRCSGGGRRARLGSGR